MREKELEKGRAELALLQQELQETRCQLSEAQSKLELYVEREKVGEAGGGRVSEKVMALNVCKLYQTWFKNIPFHS